MALEVELLKQLRDLGGLKDGNNNEQHQEVHLLHSTRLGDQDLRTPDDFESEKLGNSSQGGLGRGGPMFGKKLEQIFNKYIIKVYINCSFEKSS